MKLFVYGRLEYPHERFNASAHGELRIREPGGDAAAKFGSEYDTLVYGQLHPFSGATEAHLDTFEAPEYRRVLVQLADGEYAYAYECCTDEWEAYPIVPSGKY